MAVTVIDAHQHFWNPGRVDYPWLGPHLAPINRAIEFDELAPILRDEGIDATVLVQSSDNAEDTEYMFELAADHPQIAAIVGWVPLDRPDEAAERLELLRRRPGFVGIRNLIHDRPDPDWLLRDDVDAGLGVLEQAGVPFDLVSELPRHLEHVPTLSQRHPQLRMVIDHLSKPPIKVGNDEPWRTLIRRAAENPLVYAKVSGLYPAAGPRTEWTPGDLRPYVEVALEAFGPDRLMYGGDWPVSILAGGYHRVWAGVRAVLADLDVDDRAAILHRTATRFYRIDPTRLPQQEDHGQDEGARFGVPPSSALLR